MSTPTNPAEHLRCDLHNVACCATCCKHEGECDFGACHQPASTTVDCLDGERLIERRPACARHANYGPLGVGYRGQIRRR